MSAVATSIAFKLIHQPLKIKLCVDKYMFRNNIVLNKIFRRHLLVFKTRKLFAILEYSFSLPLLLFSSVYMFQFLWDREAKAFANSRLHPSDYKCFIKVVQTFKYLFHWYSSKSSIQNRKKKNLSQLQESCTRNVFPYKISR